MALSASPKTMAPLSSLILILFPLLTSSIPSPSPSPSLLIHDTCKAATNYRLCISTLESRPESFQAKDIKDLSLISVSIALSASTNSSSYLSVLATNATTSNVPFKAAVCVCATRYVYAREALQRAIDMLRDERYDYAALHVGAAKEYPGVCRRLFRRQQGLVYPADVLAMEEELEEFCQLALDIISLLG